MRDIKFKAWDKSRNCYCKVNAIIVDLTGKTTIAYAIENRIIDIIYENIILLQFTGLLDKNGKEVYEGDVFEISGVFSKTKSYYEVCFGSYNNEDTYEDRISGNGWYLKKINGECFEIREIDDLYNGSGMSVGNIYENLELLRKVI